ncbi:hypothetical protein ACIOZM_09875 [Pseudomonas sp. NPDC087346]|uniref:hypothetical protein n=1 Tax=Pseudomonas sp. NPDC087346 TaxID=3364438 RepID=UPI0037FF63A7
MKIGLLLPLVFLIAGCHSNVRDFFPSFLSDGVQLQQKMVTPDPPYAKIIMKASGYTYPVEFSVRRAADPDQRMEVLGTVVDSGRGQVFGWIAKLNEAANSATFKHFPQLETQTNADEPIVVSGHSTGMGNGNTYSCGPLNSSFTPERSKVYLVEFQFVGQGCEQHVYDVTRPGQRTLIGA